MRDGFQIRRAEDADVPALRALIERSGIELSAGYYSASQAASLTRHVFGVDSQLIADGTYYVVEHDAAIAGCGGWSRRRTLFGGDQAKAGGDSLLDPERDPARIRAFFVDPRFARKGIGSLLLERSIAEAVAAGFHSLELASTLPGEPLYLARGFTLVERFDLTLPDGIVVPLSRMRRDLMPPGTPPAAA